MNKQYMKIQKGSKKYYSKKMANKQKKEKYFKLN